MIRLQSAAFLVVVTIISSLNQVRGDCTPQWSGQFTPGNPDDTVRAIGEYDDDGAGPHASQLVAVGPFRSIGDSGGTLVARYDGTQWTRFGNGPAAQTMVEFNALTTWDPDGAGPSVPNLLCAGLTSDYIGNYVRYSMQEWNGASWTTRGQMGTTGPYVFNAVAVFDPDGPGAAVPYRVVGGDFNMPGLAQGIVGFRPGPVPLGSVNARITHAVLVYDEDGAGSNLPRLFAGGSFTLATSGPGDYIARWNGTSWSSVGTGFNGTVRALGIYDPDGSGPLPSLLVAGGDFTMAGATPVNHIAVWNGVAWAALGDGTDGSVYSIAEVDHDGVGPQLPVLYIGGVFDHAGSSVAHKVAAWDGSGWSALSGGIGSPTGAIVYALYGWDPDESGASPTKLYAGGNFDQVDGQEIYRIAAWDGSAWSRLTPPGNLGSNSVVRAITTHAQPSEPTRLYVGGDMTRMGTVPVSGVASFDGTAWADLAGGMNNSVHALVFFDDDGPGPHPAELYAGGDFTIAGGVSASKIARWDGAAWHPLSLGVTTSGSVYKLAVYDEDGDGPILPKLIAAGTFLDMDGIPGTLAVARWDGRRWEEIGTGNGQSTIFSMTVFDDDGAGPHTPMLVTGGPGGSWRWDGASWTSMPYLSLYTTRALTTFDPDGPGPIPPALYAGSSTTTIARAYVSRWSGSGWVDLGYFLWTGTGVCDQLCPPDIYDLAEFDDDGPGPHLPNLVAVGRFSVHSSSVTAMRNVARWNGSIWSAMDRGFTGYDGFNDGRGPQGYALHASVLLPDNGSGNAQPALYAGGTFLVAGDFLAGRVTSWGCPYVPQGPQITDQPDAAGICDGSAANFSVSATGSGTLSYHWRRNTGELSDGGNISGALTATLTVSPATMSDMGNYDCVVTDANGNALSNAAGLTAWPRGTGDTNDDGVVDGEDVQLFVKAVVEGGVPSIPYCAADMNGNGAAAPDDVGAFVDLILGL